MNQQGLPASDSPMVIFHIHRSQFFLIGPMIGVALAGLLLLGTLALANPGQSLNPLIQVLIFLFAVSGFVVATLVIWLDWYSTYYTLTSHTVEKVSGFISQNRTYMSLHDLSKIECRTGVLGSIFYFGSVVCESETSERPFYIDGVSAPTQVVDLIRSARGRVAQNDQ